MPLSVLRLLSHDRFRSGEELSRRLALSRASIHNLVARAREMGVDVQAVRGRGYRLGLPYSWLDAARLVPAGEAAGYAIQVHDRLASTNAHLLSLAQQGAAHKCVAVAEMQTDGRGRRGRSWLAEPGSGLTFSLLWRFRRPLTALSGLSLAVGVGVVRALHRQGVDAARVKWPNDILLAGGKLAGILIETQGDMLGDAAAVIGIGINVRLGPHLRARLANPLADLADGGDEDARVAGGGIVFARQAVGV
jgi:BirA family biotin operon repressor/biotin-[acetyl-CoA-carboxylase] ligase